jgi:hypothetical protein
VTDSPVPIPSDMTTILLAVQDDEIIRKAIRVTALKALQRANEMLDVGSLATRTTVIRSIMPALVKTLERKETDDELTELRRQIVELMEEIRRGAIIPELPQPPDEVYTDVPRS